MPSPEWYDGPIERLAQAIAQRRRLWVFCRGCGRGVKLNPRHLAAVWGDLTLRELQRKARCTRCQKHWAHVVPEVEPTVPGR